MGKLLCMQQLEFIVLHCACSMLTAQSWYHAVITFASSNIHCVLTFCKALSLTQVIYFLAISSCVCLYTSLSKLFFFFFIFFRMYANYTGELLNQLRGGVGILLQIEGCFLLVTLIWITLIWVKIRLKNVSSFFTECSVREVK